MRTSLIAGKPLEFTYNLSQAMNKCEIGQSAAKPLLTEERSTTIPKGSRQKALSKDDAPVCLGTQDENIVSTLLKGRGRNALWSSEP